ncbi:MAG: hypothetical protein I8H71_01480 [Xanthomonadaceae bacterium]|nr:hypothetical protein [Xanthomonadaceae bacterium]
MDSALTRTQFALDALVAAGYVTQAKVDQALALFPAPAGEPEMPEPVAYFEPDNPHNSMAFAWPGSRRMLRHASGLYTADQLRAYGGARAEHARRVAAQICDDKAARMGQEAEQAVQEGDTATVTANRAAGLVLLVCAARIRAAAPPQGEPK